ncbi:TPA: hypothetical protein ACH3X1_006749 [Trebouxia sp. C0004]
MDFSQLLKTNPRKFWQAACLPNVVLPTELHDPAAWDSFLSKLTAPPAQHATQLPAPHTPQPPAPAHSLNQPLTLAEVEVGLRHLHNGRSGALHGYTSELLRYAHLWPLQMIRHQLTCWRLALWCCSTLPSPQGRCPSPGRLPWSPQCSSMAMSQTQPQTGYRPELGTIHPAFALQHAVDKHRHANKPLYLCFVDLKSAYDKVQW